MNIEALASSPAAYRAGWALLHFLWQGAVVGAALWAVLPLMKRATANARYVAACAALLAMAVLPVVTFFLLGGVAVQSGAVLDSAAPDREAPSAVSTLAPVQGQALAPKPTATAASDSLPAAQSPVPSAGHAVSWRLSIDPYLPWLVALWAAGVLVLSVRLAGGWLKVERLKRTGVHAAPAWVADKAAALVARLLVTRPVRVLQSTIARTPVVIGWLRPVVLLPAASLVDLTPAQLEAVIAHELAHVRRCDYLVNLIQTALETLLFYHPCVWWVSSRIRAERENCCDDVAVAVCGDSASYVHALARIAQTAAAAMPLAPAARGGVLLERVSRLLGASPSHERRVTGWLAVPIVAAFAVAAVVLALPKAPLADGAVAIEAKHQEPDSPVPAVDSTGEAAHAAVPSPAPTPSTDAAISAPAATGSQVYDFANPADCAKWTNITPGPGNDFSGGAARMSAPQGRAFLLNLTPQPRDLAIEVKATNESGPAYAWLLFRYKDANNFYEVVLKQTHVEVWHKYQGRYMDILRRLDVDLGSSKTHVFKAQMEGQVPTIAVWLDGNLLWAGKDDLGVEPSDGRAVGLETEFSTIAVRSVTISAPVAVPQSAIQALGIPVPESTAGPLAPLSLDSTAPRGPIQTLIDNAAPGSVVRIAPGTYDECVVITKPLTLEGADWATTTIRQLSVDEPADASARLDGLIRRAPTRQEREKLVAQFRDKYRRPAILVSGTGPVAISGIKVIGRAGGDKDRLYDDTAIELRNAQVSLTQCAVLRSRGCGVLVLDGSQAQIRNCLVAAVWNTGIVVAGAGERPSSAEITDCDVRNCYSRCITVGRGCGSTRITSSRISGSAWHGIRYDNASPTVMECIISGNARFGIYAAGRTAATVRRNVLSNNEMAGMWCLQGNRDTVQENAFIGNKREALDIMEPSRPLISRNVFADSPVAIAIGYDGSNPSARSAEPLRLEGNVFRNNKTDITRAVPKAGSQEATVETVNLSDFPGNTEAAPSLASTDSAASGDFGIPIRTTVGSPWLIQPEESAIIPDTDTRDYQAWKLP